MPLSTECPYDIEKETLLCLNQREVFSVTTFSVNQSIYPG